MLPLVTLLGGGVQALTGLKNLPWRLIIEGLGVAMIFLLAWLLKTSWIANGELQAKADKLELDYDVAVLAIEALEESQAVTDNTVTIADDEKEQRDKRVAALLKQLREGKKPVCPAVTEKQDDGLESPENGTRSSGGAGIPHLDRVLRQATCEARGETGCSSSYVTP
jgi:hypothetical protein